MNFKKTASRTTFAPDTTRGAALSEESPQGAEVWSRWIESPATALTEIGLPLERRKYLDLRLHVIADDERYPTLCVNGDLNFGVSIDGETGELGKTRVCICAGRPPSDCVCDLDPEEDSL